MMNNATNERENVAKKILYSVLNRAIHIEILACHSNEFLCMCIEFLSKKINANGLHGSLLARKGAREKKVF